MPVRDILPQSKSMTTPVSCIKSVPNRPAITVGSSHTKNVCLNSIPSNSKEADCRPMITRASPVIPYGFKLVTRTSLLDTPGCSSETFEPVSNINFRILPSIFTNTEGVPHSSYILTVGFVKAFSGERRWKELSSFTPSLRFPKSELPSWFLACSRVQVLFQGTANVSNVRSDFLFRATRKILFFF